MLTKIMHLLFGDPSVKKLREYEKDLKHVLDHETRLAPVMTDIGLVQKRIREMMTSFE